MSCIKSEKEQISRASGGCRIQAGEVQGSESINDLVEEYLRNQCDTDEERVFANMPSLEYVIERAGMAQNDEGKRYSHQRRLKRKDLIVGTQKLRASIERVKKCQSFDELHEILISIVRDTPGLGPLYAYDTALRIGAKLGVAPSKVFLHAGTREGARALGLDYRRAYLRIEDFPKELRRIPANMLESFLCIYKRRFEHYAS